MFYNIESLPSNEPEKDFFLLNNFLDNVQVATKEIAGYIDVMSVDETDKLSFSFSLENIIEEHFKLLVNAKREFKIEQVMNPKELFTKLTNNGLVSEVLHVKLMTLDWLWEKFKNNINRLKDGTKSTLFLQLLNQLKSILKSLLNVLGISSDIFEEDFDLLMSMLEMCNQNNS